MKNNKNGKVLNVLLGVIAVFIIIFVIAWIVNRGGATSSTNNKKQFEENLEIMQETAKDYFANELPSEIGDSTRLSLEEMYELDLIDELTYGNEECDEDESFIQITKISGDEYKVKTSLVCGEKKDTTVEKIEGEIKVSDEDGNVIIDSEDDDTTTIIKEDEEEQTEDPKTSGHTRKKSTVTSTEKGCTAPDCRIVEIETTCETTYEYEFVRRTVSCPGGYSMQNGTCVRTNTESIPGTPTYTDPYTAHEPAKVNPGEQYKVYIDPIVTPGTSEKYCTEGTLVGDYCVLYENKNSSESCPSGYTKQNGACYKYADKKTETTYSCPSGYTKSGSGAATKCYKTAALQPGTTTYSCPSGYTASGSGSSMKCYKKTNATAGTTTYSCPSGYTASGSGSSMKCYKKQAVTTKTTCPTGYTPSNGKCVKTSTANKVYTAWGNPTSTYQTNTKESTYTNELTKKVLVGTTTKKVAGKTITTYTYSTYKRSAYYTCATGTLSGTLCYSYATPSTSTSCPSGYTKSGDSCYLYTNPNKTTGASTCPSGYTKSGDSCYLYTNPNKTTGASTCPSGYTKSGDVCYLYTNPNKNTTDGKCPSGYTKSGSTCYAYADPTNNTSSTCPSGYKDNGSNCYAKTDVTKAYSCPSGYTDNGANCKKLLTPSTRTNPATYACPSGYSQEGSGSSIKCYNYQKSDDKYYCDRAGATLVGKTCYYNVEGHQNGYSCPSGYALSGSTCYKTTNETTNPIWSNAEVIYSTSTYLEGYQRTGSAKFKTVCTPVQHWK